MQMALSMVSRNHGRFLGFTEPAQGITLNLILISGPTDRGGLCNKMTHTLIHEKFRF